MWIHEALPPSAPIVCIQMGTLSSRLMRLCLASKAEWFIIRPVIQTSITADLLRRERHSKQQVCESPPPVPLGGRRRRRHQRHSTATQTAAFSIPATFSYVCLLRVRKGRCERPRARPPPPPPLFVLQSELGGGVIAQIVLGRAWHRQWGSVDWQTQLKPHMKFDVCQPSFFFLFVWFSFVFVLRARQTGELSLRRRPRRQRHK